jgi:hypothetical protein
MLTRNAKGVFVIAPTPFLPDGALDLPSADRMTDAFLAGFDDFVAIAERCRETN